MTRHDPATGGAGTGVGTPQHDTSPSYLEEYHRRRDVVQDTVVADDDGTLVRPSPGVASLAGRVTVGGQEQARAIDGIRFAITEHAATSIVQMVDPGPGGQWPLGNAVDAVGSFWTSLASQAVDDALAVALERLSAGSGGAP